MMPKNIKDIKIAINILKHNRVINKNKYYYWSPSRIYEDLKGLKLEYTHQSDISVELADQTDLHEFKGTKVFNITVSLILSFVDTTQILRPISFDEHIFSKLEFYYERPHKLKLIDFEPLIREDERVLPRVNSLLIVDKTVK